MLPVVELDPIIIIIYDNQAWRGKGGIFQSLAFLGGRICEKLEKKSLKSYKRWKNCLNRVDLIFLPNLKNFPGNSLLPDGNNINLHATIALKT